MHTPQDGGEGSVGRIVDGDDFGWARVSWPNKRVHSYRVGAVRLVRAALANC
jgi:hypothetical protein